MTKDELIKEAENFNHYYLLHTIEGQKVLRQLLKNDIDLDFIKENKIGCVCDVRLFKKYLKEKQKEEQNEEKIS